MKKKICLVCLVALLTTGCGKIPKLSNGDEAVVTYKNGDKLSVNNLYEDMKKNFALQSLINLTDKHILEKEFKDYIKKAEEYTDSYTKALEEQFGGKDKLLEQIQNAGFPSIEDYKKEEYLRFMRNHAVEEYAKKQITDKEIEKFYKDVLKGDVEISHILITPKVTDKMTDDEKKKEEEKAKKTVKEIIEKLDKSKNKEEEFKKLVKKYSEDETSKKKDGSLGKITYGDLSKAYDELLDVAYNLKDGEYSKKIITTEMGYHIIFKTKSHKKESLDKVKDEIRENLSKDLIQKQKDISIKAFQYYRKEYDMEIVDKDLKKQYSNYIQNVLYRLNTPEEQQK